jgi:hypothetical protein
MFPWNAAPPTNSTLGMVVGAVILRFRMKYLLVSIGIASPVVSSTTTPT